MNSWDLLTVKFMGGFRRKARLIVSLHEEFAGEVFIDAVEVYDIEPVRRVRD